MAPTAGSGRAQESPTPVPPAVSREQGRPTRPLLAFTALGGQAPRREQLAVPTGPTAGKVMGGTDCRSPGAWGPASLEAGQLLRPGPKTSRSYPRPTRPSKQAQVDVAANTAFNAQAGLFPETRCTPRDERRVIVHVKQRGLLTKFSIYSGTLTRQTPTAQVSKRHTNKPVSPVPRE